MKHLLPVLVLMLASAASAQTSTPCEHPDVQIFKNGSVYTVPIQGPDDADMAELCLDRVDVVPMLPLGCVPAGPSERVTITATIPKTQFDDAELRAYAVDTSGLISDYSCNAGIVDFTPPGNPHVK